MYFRIILSVFFLASSILASAQEKQRVKKLPIETTTFLEANFKGIAIKEKYKEAEGATFIYKIVLENGAFITLNNRGRWLEMESKTISLPTTMLQKSVGEYIQKTYPNAKVTKVKKGNRFNFVEINNETMLQFDSAGNFYRIMENS